MSDYIPTIHDIRHKICYICRDEETFDRPEQPPRNWVHPCKCTLIAHETCLLKWIKTSETNKGIHEALKCPQCGSRYQLERNNPFVLRLCDFVNQQLQSMGYTFAWLAAGASALSIASFILWMLAKYGAYAVREFFGEEMFNLLLTDNPDNWPYTAIFQLPLVPVGLILSRFNFSTDLLPVVPIMVDIITSPSWMLQNLSSTRNKIALDPPKWPPSPIMFTALILPITRMAYSRAYRRLSRWLLGDNPPQVRVRAGEGRLVIRVAALMGGDDGGDGDGDNQQDAAQNDAAPVQPAGGAQGQNNAAANRDIEEATETAITFSDIGRRVGGALLIPAISNRMGRLLLSVSKHSKLLRKFLAVEDGRRFPALQYLPRTVHEEGNNVMKGPFGPLWLFIRTFLYGIRPWPNMDPVWWRNSVGFGLFVVASDCIQLYHQWLVKRDYDSRRIKNRNFAGIDVNTLDLIPGRLNHAPRITRVGV